MLRNLNTVCNRTFLKFCSTYFATMLATNLALTRRGSSRKLNSSENYKLPKPFASCAKDGVVLKQQPNVTLLKS